MERVKKLRQPYARAKCESNPLSAVWAGATRAAANTAKTCPWVRCPKTVPVTGISLACTSPKLLAISVHREGCWTVLLLITDVALLHVIFSEF